MKNILIKSSGDVLNNKKLIGFIKNKAKKSRVVVICGGGTQISEALIKAGYKIKYDEYGRITKTTKEKNIVKKVLEKHKKELEKIINSKNAKVAIPILKVEGAECHINGDNMVKACYLGFNSIYIFTLKGRIRGKQEIFKNYPKVKIIGM